MHFFFSTVEKCQNMGVANILNKALQKRGFLGKLYKHEIAKSVDENPQI